VCVIQNGSANYWKQTTCNLTYYKVLMYTDNRWSFHWYL